MNLIIGTWQILSHLYSTCKEQGDDFAAADRGRNQPAELGELQAEAVVGQWVQACAGDPQGEDLRDGRLAAQDAREVFEPGVEGRGHSVDRGAAEECAGEGGAAAAARGREAVLPDGAGQPRHQLQSRLQQQCQCGVH